MLKFCYSYVYSFLNKILRLKLGYIKYSTYLCMSKLKFILFVMIKLITEKLTTNPSYLKKGNEWLANYFGCSPKTVKRIKGSLTEVKKNYLASL